MVSLGIEPTASQRQKTSLNCVATIPQGPWNLKNNYLFYYKALILKYYFISYFIYLILDYKYNN